MLSVDVYQDPMRLHPRGLFGSVRRLAAAAIMAPPVGLSVTGLLIWDWDPVLVTVVMVVLCLPVALWGFAQPEGLPFEVWFAYERAAMTGPRLLFFDGPARPVRGPGKPTIQER